MGIKKIQIVAMQLIELDVYKRQFVPAELVNDYRIEMNRIFGDNSCYILTIRPVGGIEITGDGDEGV